MRAVTGFARAVLLTMAAGLLALFVAVGCFIWFAPEAWPNAVPILIAGIACGVVGSRLIDVSELDRLLPRGRGRTQVGRTTRAT